METWPTKRDEMAKQIIRDLSESCGIHHVSGEAAIRRALDEAFEAGHKLASSAFDFSTTISSGAK